jgi:preflagellin peptidase FlaK
MLDGYHPLRAGPKDPTEERVLTLIVNDVPVVPVLDLIRLTAALLILGWASHLDWKTRMVSDRVWLCMLALAMVMLVIQLLATMPGPVYLLTVVPPLAFMVPALVGIPELRQMARGNRDDLLWGGLLLLGIIIFVMEFWLLDFSHHLFYSVALVLMPIIIAITYVLYTVGLIHGGADAKAIMVLAVMFPFYPDLSQWGIEPLLTPAFRVTLLQLVFPFAITALFNAVFAFIFVPLVFFALNLSRGELGGAKSFLGYRMDVEKVGGPGSFVWLMETPPRKLPGRGGREVPGRSSVMALRDIDPAGQVRHMRRAGWKRVWVTPKIPFIIPIFFGTLVAALVGNIFFHLFDLILVLGG